MTQEEKFKQTLKYIDLKFNSKEQKSLKTLLPFNIFLLIIIASISFFWSQSYGYQMCLQENQIFTKLTNQKEGTK